MSLLDGLFGAAGGEPSARSHSWRHEELARGWANYWAVKEVMPAGIFWQKTGGKTHIVTIRRQPELVLVYKPPVD
jgi:hypothetical protein